MMGTLLQDLRYGVRMLLRQPGFTAVAIITLALGIGANSAIFSVVNAALLRPLPFKDSEQLVKLWESKVESSLGQNFQGSVSFLNLKDWREQNKSFDGLAAYQFSNYSMQAQGSPERVSGVGVSSSFFELLKVTPQIGRAFLEGEDEQGHNRVVVLSDALWRRDFAADSSIVGKNILLGGENYLVVGIMPPGFQFPSRSTQLWTPLDLTQQQLTNRDEHFLQVLGRLKSGVTLGEAQADLSTIARRIEQQYPDIQTGRGVLLIPLQEEMVRFARPALLMLLAAVGFVLLIACTNVANLLLARAAARRREIAIRNALGAGRWRLIQQFLTESVLLFLLGGTLGLIVANWGVDALRAWASRLLPRVSEVGLDWRVVGFTLLLSFLTGIVFGLAPALQSSRTDVQAALKEGGNAGGTTQRNWVRSFLVVVEIASALVLLIGAGLLIKSFARLQQTDAGFKSDNVLTAAVTLPTAKYSTPQSKTIFYQEVLEKVSALPGVESAGFVNLIPVQQAGYNGKFWVEGQGDYGQGREPIAEYRAATPDYFRTLQIPLTDGRYFIAQDEEQSAPVAIVNQTLVRHYFPQENPLGKRLRTEDTGWLEIVGVVRDVKQGGLTQPVLPEIFVPYTQAKSPNLTQGMSLVVRSSSSDPAKLTTSIRGAVQETDAGQPVHNVQTMQEILAQSISDRRLTMWLLSIFAGVAMLLSMIGIYSVMSYVVTQNTREIGIRMALGAQQRDVLKLIVGQGLTLALIGICAGLIGSLWLTKLVESLLFGVRATDPLVFVAVSVLLIMVAILASYLPARRATKVDPMIALRYE